jgi:membrane associated rhomboid family serine protease
MGFYDRDYYRQAPPSGVGQLRLWSFTTWLIVINVVVFVLGKIIWRAQVEHAISQGADSLDRWLVYSPQPLLEQWGAFSISTSILRGQLWRLLTFQFLHADGWHLFFNMLGLWLFGPVVELCLGVRRYALFYFLCGVAGPMAYVALWGMGILLPDGPPTLLVQSIHVPMVGASAGIFGVMLAAAYLAPDRPVYTLFVVMPLKYFAWIMMAVAAYTVLVNGNNAGGQAAHLGGGVLGWILIRNDRVLDFAGSRRRVHTAVRRRVRRPGEKDWSRDFNR